MTAVALMSQPMRSNYCLAYIRAHPQYEWVLLTEHSLAPLREPSPESLGVHLLRQDERSTSGTLHSIARRARWRLTAWGQSGSKPGEVVLRIVRSILRLRWRVLAARPVQHSTSSAGASHAAATAELLATLFEVDLVTPIELIAVFDLFDLPAALAFAQGRDLPIMIK